MRINLLRKIKSKTVPFRKKSFLACTIGVSLMRPCSWRRKKAKSRWWVRPWGKEGRREKQVLANKFKPRSEDNRLGKFYQLFPVGIAYVYNRL